MQKHIRNGLALLISTVIVWIAVPVVQHFLFEAFLRGRTFSSASEWMDTLSLLQWLFYIFIFTVFGFILSKLINSARCLLWVASLGFIYAIFLAVFSRNYFFREASVASHFWVYGVYAMPILGALLGYLLHLLASRRALRHLTTQPR